MFEVELASDSYWPNNKLIIIGMRINTFVNYFSTW